MNKNQLLIVIVLFSNIISCVMEKPKKEASIDSKKNHILTILDSVTPDSLEGLSLEWRQKNALTLRYNYFDNPSDSVFPLLILLKRSKNNLIQFKVGSQWVNIDSLRYYRGIDTTNLSKGKVIYSYELMESQEVEKISSLKNENTLLIDILGETVFYTRDSSYYKKRSQYFEVEPLSTNWWLIKR